MEAFVKSKSMIVFLFACNGGRQIERKQEAERQRKRSKGRRQGDRDRETGIEGQSV